MKSNVTMSIVCDTAVRTKTTTLTQHVSLVDEYCWNMRRRIAQERLEHTLREFVICFTSSNSLPMATVYLHLFFQLGHAHLRRHVMAQASGFRQQAGMLVFCEACRAWDTCYSKGTRARIACGFMLPQQWSADFLWRVDFITF